MNVSLNMYTLNFKTKIEEPIDCEQTSTNEDITYSTNIAKSISGQTA